ncbi:MAG: hypothetical protein ACOC0N_11625 [Chroococcales cyanobacterium]
MKPNVIRLYQKINELLYEPSDDDLTLEQLFLKVDRIGQKYQTPEEIQSFHEQLATEVNAISDKIDEQFPDTEMEFIDFSQNNRVTSNNERNRKKYY